MIPELGHAALVFAFCLSVAAMLLSGLAAARHQPAWHRAGISSVVGVFVLSWLSLVCLAAAFVTDDFSVAYVAANSNSALPWYYKVSAVWGAHEGSFLLWCCFMATWMVLVCARPPAGSGLQFHGIVVAVLAMLNVGFLSFLIWTSNPFARLVPLAPPDGADLNPLLQDFGLIVHPPMLYLGYVGLSVSFAFAIAALFTGRLDTAWARWSRPWTNVAWAFLTLGIALGSWWAYYELGWGGWWFWDPVENASFMPWLVATALIHSLAVTEKRGLFKSWTVLLAVAGFSLCLLGAFIVRSGVLTSVHAFAVDPTRGQFILVFLGLIVGGSLLLYAVRAYRITRYVSYGLVSREFALLINNALLVIAAAFVLYGTLYPLAYEVISGGGKISVGVPFFNFGFVPLMLVLAGFLAAVPLLQWKRSDRQRLWRGLRMALILAVVATAASVVLIERVAWQVAATLGVALMVIWTHVADVVRRVRRGQRRLPLAYVGMTAAHLGFALSMLGVALTSQFSVEKDLRVDVGESVRVGDLEVTLLEIRSAAGPNYSATQGVFEIRERGSRYLLIPEKRHYSARGNVMTEAAIDAGLLRDVYVSLGEPLDEGGWSARVHLKPFVRWIWLGAVVMALAAMLAVLDRRYRALHRRARQAHSGSEATA